MLNNSQPTGNEYIDITNIIQGDAPKVSIIIATTLNGFSWIKVGSGATPVNILDHK
jgi:hypothetical protein